MIRPLAGPVHACPGGCGTQVSEARLSCQADWFRLPSGIRHRINTAYRSRTKDPLSHVRAVAEALNWYRDNNPKS